MRQFDVSEIVPSTRDLLQVLSTRRRNLALAAEIGSGDPGSEAARLADANVSAFALAEAGPAMVAAARATKTVPSFCLAAVATREDCQKARFYGADGVCIDASLPATEWDNLAKIARGMRMLPLALARTEAEVELAGKAGARAVVLRASTAAEVLALAQKAARGVTLVADIAPSEGATRAIGSADAAALRELMGKVDSAVVPTAVCSSESFGDLVAELDP